MEFVLPPQLFETFGPTAFRALPYNQTTENFINHIIEEQDRDMEEEKEYLGYVVSLLKNRSKYRVFSSIFPANTCDNEIVLTDENQFVDYDFVDCVRNSTVNKAISFYYENHANAMFFDPVNKIINRYDPQAPGYEPSQKILDNTLRRLFNEVLPEYTYIGNTLIDLQCVQTVREQGRKYKGDYYCQDYSLLYMTRRFAGMSHEEAAENLVAVGEDVKTEIADILRLMSYTD